MIEKLLDARIETIETITRRLDALPAANGEPFASYWQAVRTAARELLDVADAKCAEYEAQVDQQNAELEEGRP